MLKLEARRQAKLHSIMLAAKVLAGPGFACEPAWADGMEAVITGESRWRQ
jgi:hypothetical protein